MSPCGLLEKWTLIPLLFVLSMVFLQTFCIQPLIWYLQTLVFALLIAYNFSPWQLKLAHKNTLLCFCCCNSGLCSQPKRVLKWSLKQKAKGRGVGLLPNSSVPWTQMVHYFYTEDNSRANCFIHHSWPMWPGWKALTQGSNRCWKFQ